jgi:hypothetical protein
LRQARPSCVQTHPGASDIKFFKQKGLKTICIKSARDTEALKLIDTFQYGWLIALEKNIHQFCEDNDLDFDTIYTLGNKTYNEGYTKLKRPEVVRPYLKHMKGKIGGHCVIQNCHLTQFHLAKKLLELNRDF